MRWWVSVCIVFLVVFTSSAQTETPTPTATATLTPAPYVFATIAPSDGTPPGQLTRFDYVSTAGDVHIANLLTLDVISGWGQFLFSVIFITALARRRK
jgi:hypothetical protein